MNYEIKYLGKIHEALSNALPGGAFVTKVEMRMIMGANDEIFTYVSRRDNFFNKMTRWVLELDLPYDEYLVDRYSDVLYVLFREERHAMLFKLTFAE